MNLEHLWNEFKAFNINGFSNLAYILLSNWWYALIAVSCLAAIIMYLKSEVEVTVREEQQIL